MIVCRGEARQSTLRPIVGSSLKRYTPKYANSCHVYGQRQLVFTGGLWRMSFVAKMVLTIIMKERSGTA
jgi:hypothetical protein